MDNTFEARSSDDPSITRHPCSPPPPTASFTSLPTEIRLKIWSHATEPRIAILNDLISQPKAYSLPSVTQLNFEAWSECRLGYQPAGRGSYFHFSRDILICDHLMVDQTSDCFLEELAPKIQRLAFWDCVPDDEKVAHPLNYEENLHDCYGRRISEKIDFDNLWFPNLKELWIVKIGDVDPAWGVKRDQTASPDAQRKQLARQFRYWVKEGAIEMAALDLAEPDMKMILEHGRCREENCQELNRNRPVMVSRVSFEDRPYDQYHRDEAGWTRIMPVDNDLDSEEDSEARTAYVESRMRWALVERVLIFSLRWEGEAPSDNEEPPPRSRRVTTAPAEDV